MSAWGLSHYTEEGCMTNTHTRVLVRDFDLNKPPREDCDLGLSVGMSNENSGAVQSHGLSLSRLMHELFDEAMGTGETDEADINACGMCMRRMLHDFSDQLKAETSKKWPEAENVPMPQQSPEPLGRHEEPIFSCPICLDNLTEPTATKCGHIFCKECILKSLKSLPKKCPTCRKRLPKGSIFRIYLPTTN